MTEWGNVKKYNDYKESGNFLMLPWVSGYKYHLSIYQIVISMKKIRKYSEHGHSYNVG
jgi:hypothetical protein